MSSYSLGFFLIVFYPYWIESIIIQSDVLIIPDQAQVGDILLEEISPSRSNEFHQCLNDRPTLKLTIDEKYGDLLLGQTVENLSMNEQTLLCTIHRNEVSEKRELTRDLI